MNIFTYLWQKVVQFYHWVYYLRVDVLIKELVETKQRLRVLPDRNGEVAVVTGGAMGFGLEVVKILLKCNYRVIVGDICSGEQALDAIQKAGLSTENVEYLSLNLKSLKSVRNFAKEVLQRTSRVDLLFNNAGIMFAPYQQTEDGCESQFQVNYLSHFLLTNLLLPTIKQTGMKKQTCCRIVQTSSLAAALHNLNINELEDYKMYAANHAYACSKLAQALHATYLDFKLQEQQARVRVYSVHPGIVPSKLWDNIPWMFGLLLKHLPSYRTTEDGAHGIIYAALAPELEEMGGIFLDNCEITEPNTQLKDFNLMKSLWEKSINLTQD